MQEGIGRDGYRMLTVVFGLLTAIGLGVAGYAFSPHWDLLNGIALSLCIIGAGMLVSINLIMLNKNLVPSARAAAAAAAGPVTVAAPVKPALPPAADIDYEFSDPTPAASAAPESLVLPAAFDGKEDGDATIGPETVVDLEPREAGPKDPKAWPERRGKSGVTRRELAERYTRNSPAVREILLDQARSSTLSLTEVPMVVAKTASPEDSPDWTPEGMTRGKCGGCGTVLLAPAERPMKLRCPQCDKVTLLK